MELNTLQDRINKNAEAKFDAMMTELCGMMRLFPILSSLEIKGPEGSTVRLFSGNYGRGLFETSDYKNYWLGSAKSKTLADRTNFLSVREEMIADLAKQETDELFRKLEDIGTYLDNQH